LAGAKNGSRCTNTDFASLAQSAYSEIHYVQCRFIERPRCRRGAARRLCPADGYSGEKSLVAGIYQRPKLDRQGGRAGQKTAEFSD
jgi:hypothetical protein